MAKVFYFWGNATGFGFFWRREPWRLMAGSKAGCNDDGGGGDDYDVAKNILFTGTFINLDAVWKCKQT